MVWLISSLDFFPEKQRQTSALRKYGVERLRWSASLELLVLERAERGDELLRHGHRIVDGRVLQREGVEA